MRPGAFDYAVVVLMIVATLVDWRWYWPRCVRAIRAGVSGIRMRYYRFTMAGEWAFTLFVLRIWIAKGRGWYGLWLRPLGEMRLRIGLLFAAIVIALLVLQERKVQKALARPKAVARLREQLAFADPLTPQTSAERHGFWVLAVTAGICEELLFRGFLMWLIAAWTDLVIAVIVSSVLFGCAHIYLGARHVLKTAIVGLVLALIVVASSSLWPAIVIHVALDLSAGEISFHVAQAASTTSEAAPPVAS